MPCRISPTRSAISCSTDAWRRFFRAGRISFRPRPASPMLTWMTTGATARIFSTQAQRSTNWYASSPCRRRRLSRPCARIMPAPATGRRSATGPTWRSDRCAQCLFMRKAGSRSITSIEYWAQTTFRSPGFTPPVRPGREACCSRATAIISDGPSPPDGAPAATRQERLLLRLVSDGRRDDEEHEIDQAGVRDRMIDARRQENVVVFAHDMILAVDVHQTLALDHVIDLLLHLVFVHFHIGHRLVHRDAIVDVLRTGGFRHHQRLRQRAAEMIGKLAPRHLGDVADEPFSCRCHDDVLTRVVFSGKDEYHNIN